MGESFLGLPNRFKIINNLLENTYNPNHALSAHQGYRLATDYVKRSGGLTYAMTGNLYTQSLLPTPDVNNPKDIGTETYKYRNIYAQYLYGIAQSADKLSGTRKISLTGSVTGEVTTDLSGNVSITTTTNHNHDSLYVKKTGNSPTDPITGPLYARAIVPTSDVLYSLGTSAKRWASIFTKDLTATSISGSLTGNASTATKLQTARNITVSLTPSTDVNDKSGVASFNGSSNITINLSAPYLPINGGTLYGKLTTVGSIMPSTNNSYSLGDIDHIWNSIYGGQIHGDEFYGTKFYGDSSTATKLKTARKITVVLSNSDNTASNYGSNTFDGSSDVSISVWAPYLPINGGSVSGNILPKTSNAYTLGNTSYKFSAVYANNLYGNAATTTKLATARTLTIGNTGKTFDGSANVSWSLSEIGAASDVVGTVITGTSYRGLYILGTKTGYLESSIFIPPGTWLLDAYVWHCVGNVRIFVSVEDILSGDVLASLPSINPGECCNHYWSTYKGQAIYVNSSGTTVQACIFLDTSNISDDASGTTYEANWAPVFNLKAVRLK